MRPVLVSLLLTLRTLARSRAAFQLEIAVPQVGGLHHRYERRAA
jgi:hypothetical protein